MMKKEIFAGICIVAVIVLVGAALVMFSHKASAATHHHHNIPPKPAVNKYYLAFDIGMAKPNKSNGSMLMEMLADLATHTFKHPPVSSFQISGGGLITKNFGLETSISYTNFKHTATPITGSGNKSSQEALVRAYGSIVTYSQQFMKFQTFFKASIGAHRLLQNFEIDPAIAASIKLKKLKVEHIGWSYGVGFGVLFNLTEKIGLKAGVNVDWDKLELGTRHSYTAIAGLRYKF